MCVSMYVCVCMCACMTLYMYECVCMTLHCSRNIRVSLFMHARVCMHDFPHSERACIYMQVCASMTLHCACHIHMSVLDTHFHIPLLGHTWTHDEYRIHIDTSLVVLSNVIGLADPQTETWRAWHTHEYIYIYIYVHTYIHTHKSLTGISKLIGLAGFALFRDRIHGNGHGQVVKQEVDTVFLLGHEGKCLDLFAIVLGATQNLAALIVYVCIYVFACLSAWMCLYAILLAIVVGTTQNLAALIVYVCICVCVFECVNVFVRNSPCHRCGNDSESCSADCVCVYMCLRVWVRECICMQFSLRLLWERLRILQRSLRTRVYVCVLECVYVCLCMCVYM